MIAEFIELLGGGLALGAEAGYLPFDPALEVGDIL